MHPPPTMNGNTPGKCIKDAWGKKAETEGQYSAVRVLISGRTSWEVFLYDSYHGKLKKLSGKDVGALYIFLLACHWLIHVWWERSAQGSVRVYYVP